MMYYSSIDQCKMAYISSCIFMYAKYAKFKTFTRNQTDHL